MLRLMPSMSVVLIFLTNDGTPGSNYASQDSAGAQSLESVIQEVTGITPQYYIHADYTVLTGCRE